MPCAAFRNGSVNGNGLCSSSTRSFGCPATWPVIVTDLPNVTIGGGAAISDRRRADRPRRAS